MYFQHSSVRWRARLTHRQATNRHHNALHQYTLFSACILSHVLVQTQSIDTPRHKFQKRGIALVAALPLLTCCPRTLGASLMASQHRPAPMDKAATLALNLEVLKRQDPATEEVLPRPPTSRHEYCAQLMHFSEAGDGHQGKTALCLQILASAGQVALYEFNEATKSWVPPPAMRDGLPCAVQKANQYFHPGCLPCAASERRGGRTIPAAPQHTASLPTHHPQQEEPECVAPHLHAHSYIFVSTPAAAAAILLLA